MWLRMALMFLVDYVGKHVVKKMLRISTLSVLNYKAFLYF
jgi:hypothetical protein